MNYSRHHKAIARCLFYRQKINEQDVLDYPENYIGLNYKEVLNSWFYWDSLTSDQRYVFSERCVALDYETHQKAYETSRKLAREVIDPRFVGYLCSWEREIIAAHLYIEQGIPFTYLPLIFDL